MRKTLLAITVDTTMLKIINTESLVADLKKMAKDMEKIAERDDNPLMGQKATGVWIAIMVLEGYQALKCKNCYASKNTKTQGSCSNIFCDDTSAWHGPTYCCAWHHTERRPTEGACR